MIAAYTYMHKVVTRLSTASFLFIRDLWTPIRSAYLRRVQRSRMRIAADGLGTRLGIGYLSSFPQHDSIHNSSTTYSHNAAVQLQLEYSQAESLQVYVVDHLNVLVELSVSVFVRINMCPDRLVASVPGPPRIFIGESLGPRLAH